MKKNFVENITVLLAESNMKSLNDLSLILYRNGFYVKKVESGFEALHAMEQDRYMVAVLSEQLKDMSGKEVSLLIREVYNMIELPILMTGSFEEESKEQLIALAKSFGINDCANIHDPNEIIKKIHRLAKIYEIGQERKKKAA